MMLPNDAIQRRAGVRRGGVEDRAAGGTPAGANGKQWAYPKMTRADRAGRS